MSQVLTIEVSDDVVKRASEIARRTHCSIEEVLTEWFAHGGTEPPVEMLPDSGSYAFVQSKHSKLV